MRTPLPVDRRSGEQSGSDRERHSDVVRARASATPRSCGTATSPTSTPRERARLAQHVRHAPPARRRAGVPSGAHRAAPRRGRRAPHPARASCAAAASPAASRYRRPQHAAAPGRAAGRRLRLDGARTPTRCCGSRTSGSAGRPRTDGGLHHRHPAHPGHPALRGRDPERGAARGGRARCPTGPAAPGSARRCKAFLDRWGAARHGPRCGRRLSSATAGSAATPGLLAEQMARLHRLAHRVVWVNPHRGKAGYAAGRRAGSSPRCPTSTTSSPGTRWRRSPSWWRWSRVREVLAELLAWWRAGRPVGVGTVVATFRSAPRPPGASMLVGPDGEAVGSVSGGCVEGAVYELAQEVVGSGRPVLQRYGISDDDAFAVGLTCGGILDVFVEKVDPRDVPRARRRRRRHRGRPAGRRRHRHRAPRPGAGSAGGVVVRPDVPAAGVARLAPGRRRRRDDARGLLAAGRIGHADLRPGRRAARRGDARVRLGLRAQAADARLRRDRLRRRRRPGRLVPRLPRDGLRRPPGLRDADALPGRRRGRRRVAAPVPGGRGGRRPDRRPHRDRVLTHDPKFDVPLLEVALRLPEVAYVGAMGSRRTHDDRRARLLRGRAHRARAGAALAARSASTSAPGRPRRPRSPSPPRSSPCGGAATAAGSASATARSITSVAR